MCITVYMCKCVLVPFTFYHYIIMYVLIKHPHFMPFSLEVDFQETFNLGLMYIVSVCNYEQYHYTDIQLNVWGGSCTVSECNYEHIYTHTVWGSCTVSECNYEHIYTHTVWGSCTVSECNYEHIYTHTVWGLMYSVLVQIRTYTHILFEAHVHTHIIKCVGVL